MKITNIETLCLTRLHERERQWFTLKYRTVKADCAIVVISTNEGIQGIGEACAYGVPTLIKEWVGYLAPTLVGHDPRKPDLVPHPTGLNRSYDTAVGGIDSALWDLKGKIEGKRVSELLGGSAEVTEVPMYASGGCRFDWRTHPEQLIEEVLGYIEAGFKATKVRMGLEWAWDGVTIDRYLGLMAELMQTVDGRIQVMVDGNKRLNFDDALVITRGLDKLGLSWFEEPLPQEDIDGYARLNAAVEMPITGGETLTTLGQFRPYFEKKAYAIVQPDAGVCGISELVRIAEMADHYNVTLNPHNWHNGLMTMANAHFVAATSNSSMLEVCQLQGPLQWEILAEKPVFKNGNLILPDKPGLGVELAGGLLEKFPYIEGHYAVEIQRA
jgi:L-alanine-DL-glutamate epimerase-like enolase superfamily enzyme